VTFHDPDFHRRETTLLASRNAAAADFTRIIGLVESGTIDTTPWIAPPVPALEAIDRFPQWASPDPGVIKAMIAF
jgi:threonine dehydrogenase-like Zn-dependent dehydrogenase